MKTIEEIKIGDTVRFVCQKFDDDGRITDTVIRVTGKLIEIEPIGSCEETNFPKYWVRRNGKNLWYSGDALQLIRKAKRSSLRTQILNEIKDR